MNFLLSKHTVLLLQKQKDIFFRFSTLSCYLLVYSFGANASAIYDPGTLNFASSAQSMWGTGTAFRKQETTFLGTQWSNKTATIGGIAGSQNTIITPEIPSFQITPAIPRTQITPAVPAVVFAGVTITPAIPAVYSPYVPAVYSPYVPAITADTRTGAKIDVNSSGKVGLEFGYTIDSGSVDSNVNFSATANIPDPVNASEFFDLGTGSNFDSGSIDTQSPEIEAYISAVMQLSGSIDAQACGVLLGCASGSTSLPTVNMNQRILSVDPGSLKILDGVLPGGAPLAEMPILNQSLTLEGAVTPVPPYAGFKLTGPGGLTLVTTLPPTPAITVELAELSVNVPNISTSGTKTDPNTVTSNGRDDLLSAQLDLDGAATIFGGLPPLGFGVDLIDAGPIKVGAQIDLIDVDAGPVLGITQDFELTPTLMADLLFSNPINIDGMSGLQTSWTGVWDDLPNISIFDDTVVTPTYWTDVILKNDLGLDLGLVGTLDILKFGATASVAGVDILNFGPLSLNGLLGLGNNLFETDKVGFSVYDNQFSLGGFNRVQADPFSLLVATLDSGSGTHNGGGAVDVSEPATFWLLLAGLPLVISTRNRKR